MVADELAVTLTKKYVQPGYRVLDPFCGSGSFLLAAANNPGEFVGIDVNPLGCLITMAKSVPANVSSISELITDIDRARLSVPICSLDLRETRRVPWYSDTILDELSQIVSWINKLQLDFPEKTVVSAALSAAVRDASYCRKHSILSKTRRLCGSRTWSTLCW